MAGGLLQLLLFGQQNIYLMSNPNITFFKKVFRTHTNFSMESKSIPFDKTSTNIYDQTTLKIKLPRNADLVNQMYFTCEIPDIISDNISRFKWIPNIGCALLDYYTITIGGNLIDKQYGDFLHVQKSFNYTNEKKDLFDKMTGNVPSYYDPSTNFKINPIKYRIGTIYPSSLPSQTLFIPLNFWFNKEIGSALPLISLQYSEVEITIVLRPWVQLYQLFYNKNGIKGYYAPDLSIPEHNITNFISNTNKQYLLSQTSINCFCYLEANYIFLDTVERNYFAYKPLDYLIEQLTAVDISDIGQYNTTQLVLQNPVKEIYWYLQRSDLKITNDWFNYLDNGSKILLTAKILFNGVDRIDEKPAEFFNFIQPFQHHTGNSEEGLYLYSFSLEPEKFQPSGSCNMSRVNSIQFYMNSKQPTNNTYTYNGRFYITNYNFLRISSGMAGVVFNI